MYEEVKEEIKICEGYVPKIYKCSEGFDTIFYGHKITPEDQYEHGVEYSKEELDAVFESDFKIALTSAEELLEGLDVPETVKGIVCEMCFQLGKPRVMKFKRMWEGIEAGDYNAAADEMIDSNWHKQTTARCEDLAELMRSCA